jgi:hypothetical protein
MAFQNIKIQIEERNLNKYIDTALKKYKWKYSYNFYLFLHLIISLATHWTS